MNLPSLKRYPVFHQPLLLPPQTLLLPLLGLVDAVSGRDTPRRQSVAIAATSGGDAGAFSTTATRGAIAGQWNGKVGGNIRPQGSWGQRLLVIVAVSAVGLLTALPSPRPFDPLAAGGRRRSKGSAPVHCSQPSRSQPGRRH
jgi:hypothetical protein